MRGAVLPCLGVAAASALIAGQAASREPASAASTVHPTLGPPITQRTFSDTTFDGYKLRATFRVFHPARVTALPVLPYDHRSSLACPVDGTTDGVVPVTFTLTNTTPHTSIGLGTTVVFYVNPSRNISQLKFDGKIGNQVRCMRTTAANGALYADQWNRLRKPGQGERADLFVVVPGLYTAGHPDGNNADLRTLGLDVFLYANGEVPGHNRFRTSSPPRYWLVRLGT